MTKPLNIGKEELYDLYITQNLSSNEIAEKFGCSQHPIFDRLKKYGIEIKSNVQCHTSVHIRKEELVELYVNQEMSSLDIAKLYQCGSETVLRRLKKFNIPTRDRVSAIRLAKSKTFIDKEILDDLYVAQEKSIKQISKITGYSKNIIFSSLKEHKIERRSPYKTIKYEPSKEELIELYVNKKMKIYQISDFLDCSAASINQRLRKCGIEIRNAPIGLKGEENPMWRGGISNGNYCNKFTSECKELNRDKFNRKCFLCGKNELDNIKSNGDKRKLCVHHVDYDKNQGCNAYDWKLVPLCHSCHSKTHYNRNYFDWLFSTLLIIREMILEYGNKIAWRSII
ncbi:HNH endonuclease [Candidatus Dependentiae bacterium]|nr:HNH endonuclease [Candidatus Dependentiae bacterium]